MLYRGPIVMCDTCVLLCLLFQVCFGLVSRLLAALSSLETWWLKLASDLISNLFACNDIN